MYKKDGSRQQKGSTPSAVQFSNQEKVFFLILYLIGLTEPVLVAEVQVLMAVVSMEMAGGGSVTPEPW